MDKENTNEINSKIREVCEQYQSERISGRWYMEQTGLNKIAKLLGGEYKSLTKTQRAVFRHDCVDYVHSGCYIKNWSYYINQ